MYVEFKNFSVLKTSNMFHNVLFPFMVYLHLQEDYHCYYFSHYIAVG